MGLFETFFLVYRLYPDMHSLPAFWLWKFSSVCFILFGLSALFVNIKGSFKLIPSISIFSFGRWFRG